MAKQEQVFEGRVASKSLDNELPIDLADGTEFVGTRKTDIFFGSQANDLAIAKDGNDILLGNGGEDTLRGNRGSDLIFGNQGDDLVFGDRGNDLIFGKVGNDQIEGGRGHDFLYGGRGNDTLTGGKGHDILVGRGGIDTLTGGRSADAFVFSGNVFSGGTPEPVENTGIQALNLPDLLTDYQIGRDQFVFDASDLNVDGQAFQQGVTSQIASNGNFLVLLDPFVNAGTAAQAIAANDAITADAGAFVYFNTTLGINRLVYSQDLNEGGNISVLANLTNQAGAAGLDSLTSYSASDFSLL